ncbi:Sialic acid TRAP transporter permease protein SiaT [Vibrio ruber DSM 16370]|uniref:Sialic acid TRAP transporter permease protein SiaT n=1 Tax=Vibrio ruber (strain DSM 16370 / JCM 11486 / BCRC 17186 / CECT 7878 / LMG 23124 / VR1) TaxID=1123498 RepID=A0A1R4LTK1_VIBR1|nr:TRAP transporter fused permease subunit [Vibrio ruber]SJN59719.1 Sialic acid TRAP transporter permease protein SiaT [Vibrio ruber DSM 16370]
MTQVSSRHTKFANSLSLVTGLIAVLLTVFQIWQGITADLSATVFRPTHLSWVLILVFLAFPFAHIDTTSPAKYVVLRCLDIVLIILTCWAASRVIPFDYDDISFLLDGLQPEDQYAGLLLILLLLEATRRTVGMVMVFVAVIFLSYALFGNVLPDAIASKGFSLEEMVRFHIYSTNGVFGAPLAIAAGVVFVFVLFGAFLQVSGAGQFFIDAAFAIAGKSKGGPAKASVLASAALGSISGSAIANTVTTGSLTIPMMKRLGYKAEQAAGIEAAASTGGQIMPPVMGAGAFVMAQFTGIPYSEIILVSIAPAILYFACTLLYVHLMACKLNLQGMSETEKIGRILQQGWHFLLPLVMITALLMMSYSPILVGIAGCAAILIAALTRRQTKISVRLVLEGMKEGAILALPISIACATAGIVVGVVGQTGIGLQFTQFLTSLSGGHLWSALLFIAIAAVILGMGLPVTAAYIVLSVMAVPALMELGVPLLTAHMIVFWLSQTSNVTPPIALAAFAGAGIANASPMRSAVQAFKLAQGFFLIPAMMAFSGLIWIQTETPLILIESILGCIALIIAFSAAIEGYLFRPVPALSRLIFLLLAAIILFVTDDYRLIGVVCIAVLMVWEWKKSRLIPVHPPTSSLEK